MTYILGCNTRWGIVREGLGIAAFGGVIGSLALAGIVIAPESAAPLALIGGFTLGFSVGLLGLTLNRSRINDALGHDVWDWEEQDE